jgi:hypothetical protein
VLLLTYLEGLSIPLVPKWGCYSGPSAIVKME